MILLVIVIRFIFFILGTCLGLAAAIAALPLPGKTFFNRMSKLPKGARSLIDNAIDLAISITQLISSLARDLAIKTNEVAQASKEKFKDIKDKIEIEKKGFQSNKESDKKVDIEDKEVKV